jgi:transposase
MSNSTTCVAGIDIGKDNLDAAIHGGRDAIRLPNTAEGCRHLADWLLEHGVVRVGMEASGGYERMVLETLRKAGFEVALLQPRQVRAFAAYRLKRAKNDRIDTALIAEVTASLDKVRASPDPRLACLAEHLRLIEQIEADLSRMKTRDEAYRTPRLKGVIAREITRLEGRLKAELALLLKTIGRHADLLHRLELIESVDGVGRRTALGMLILLPELGQLSREEIACLAGLAPFDHDSGRYSGQRRIAGGRHRVRRTIYAAAFPASMHWNTSLKTFYRRLRDKGKTHKQALTACSRKLLTFVNAVVARGSQWSVQPPAKANGC